MSTPIDYSALPDDALLRQKQLTPIVPFSGPTLWRRVKAGTFPSPVRLEGRITAWRWRHVREWLQAQGRAA